MHLQFLSVFLLLMGMNPYGSSIPLQKNSENDPLLLMHSRKACMQQFTDPEPIFAFDILNIPLKRAGNLLLIEVEIDSLRGNFIFDTGAPGLVLNNTYFRNYKKISGYYASGVTGSNGSPMVTEVQELKIKDLSYTNVEANVINLGHIENVRGVKILGLLGLNLFSAFEMEIDVRSSVLRLYKCSKKGDPIVATTDSFEIVHKIRVFDNTIFIDGVVANKNLIFGFDTGAEINALSSRSNKKVLEKVRITGRSSLIGTGEQPAEIIYGRLNEFYLGTHEMHGMRILITQMSTTSDAYGTRVDGILGYDFLDRGVVRINVRKGEMQMRLFDTFKQG